MLQSSHGSQVRKTTMPMSFLYLFHVPAHSPIWWQTVFSLSVSPNQIKPSFSNSVISQLSGQHYLQFHPGCHLQDCTVSYSVTRELSSVTDQASGTLWNPVTGSVKDVGEKSKAILNIALEREVLHLRFEAESQHPQLIQWVIISSLDWVHTRYFWTVWWIVLTDASHGTQRFGQRLFCTLVYAFPFSSVLQRWMICSAKM